MHHEDHSPARTHMSTFIFFVPIRQRKQCDRLDGGQQCDAVIAWTHSQIICQLRLIRSLCGLHIRSPEICQTAYNSCLQSYSCRLSSAPSDPSEPTLSVSANGETSVPSRTANV